MNVQERIKEMSRNGKHVYEIAEELHVFPKCVVEVLQGKDVFADTAMIHTWDIDKYMETVSVGDSVIVYVNRTDPLSKSVCSHNVKLTATVTRKFKHIVATTEGFFQNKEIYMWNHNRGRFSRELCSDGI